MRDQAVVQTGMTVSVSSVLRCALRRLPRKWGPWTACLLMLACAGKSPDYDQEFELTFTNPNQQYSVVVDKTERMVKFGSRSVQVRISGGSVMEVIVRVFDAKGGICNETTVHPTAPSEAGPPPGPIEVTITCTDGPVGPVAEPDAGASPDALMADTAPPLMPDAGPSAACERYCGVMRDRCPLVYTASDGECLATCAAFGWPEGNPGSASNSVECRIEAATAPPVPGNPIVNCYHAGPSGGNRCGTLCLNHCEIAARACPDLVPGGSLAECKAQCLNQQVATPAYRADSGNTIECRIFWLGKALEDGGKSCARLTADAQDPACHD
jgi:hypothetical protein